MPVKLLAPALTPYRLEFVASQVDKAVSLAPLLKLVISAWPFLLCQKPKLR